MSKLTFPQEALQPKALLTLNTVPTGHLQRESKYRQPVQSGGEDADRNKRQSGILQRAAIDNTTQEVPSSVFEVLRSPGQPLNSQTRSFMEPRFGHDFSGVRVHTDAKASKSARAVNALAYTVGRNVVFAHHQYLPGTSAGRRLIAHELTHVIQQQGNSEASHSLRIGPVNDVFEAQAERAEASIGANNISDAGSNATPQTGTLQRSVHEGHDHGGRYEFDDQRCTFNYHQSWYFTFRTNQSHEERTNYMEAARRQIEDVWSRKFPLIPDQSGCFCHSGGVTVIVTVHPHERERQGHGFTIIVTPTEERGWTTQPLRQIDLSTAHDQPVPNTGVDGGQRVIAHEFGHTIGLTDEYHWWSALFNTEGSRDRPSIMHSGDEVRPRHYQHFADLINFEVGDRCTYRPAGRRFPEYENPPGRFRGFPFISLPERAEFVIGLNYDRRIGNEALLGLIYPMTGVMSLWNPVDRSVQTGPTLGLRLNQIAHPLYVNVRTGFLFDPANPRSVLDLRIPISAEIGIRRSGFQFGASYTGIHDILNTGNWTHLIGVDLQVDLP